MNRDQCWQSVHLTYFCYILISQAKQVGLFLNYQMCDAKMITWTIVNTCVSTKLGLDISIGVNREEEVSDLEGQRTVGY